MNLVLLLEHLGQLELPPQDYAVFGSAPLLARGLIQEIEDIDIVARGSAWARAQSLGQVLDLGHVHRAPQGDSVIYLGQVDIYDGWLGMDRDQLIDTAETFYGFPFVRLEHVLTYKQKLQRPKDLPHLQLLQTHLKS